jgi:hypothetical protein
MLTAGEDEEGGGDQAAAAAVEEVIPENLSKLDRSHLIVWQVAMAQ